MSSGALFALNKRPADQVADPALLGKKPKTDHANSPSKVLHARNLPPKCEEPEIIAICAPFGQVINVLVLKEKRQAFVEMQDENAAISLMTYYSQVQPKVRNHSVYFGYSSRERITAPVSQPGEGINNVLLITINNLLYPVNVDVLHQVFSKFGNILRIVTFNKGGRYQALIEYADAPSAAAAKLTIDGQNIYAGCCTLKIDFSSLKTLQVKFNNDASRDYTNPTLPVSGDGSKPTGSLTSSMGPPFGSGSASLLPSNPGIGYMGGMGPSPQDYMQAASMQASNQFAPLNAGMNPGLNQMPGGASLMGMQGMPGMSSMSSAMMQSTLQMQGNASNMSSLMGGGGPVLIASNLDPDSVNPDILFTLFGVYGDVMRVKILYNKKDNALIQMANAQQAEIARTHLNGCPLFGKRLNVNTSKYAEVSLPKANMDENAAHLTKDFSSSNLHRFKQPGSKNYAHICPPGVVLHISNLSPSVTVDELTSLLRQFGSVQNLKYLGNDRKMALVQFADVEQAVSALISLHNYRLADTNIRVSFSKSQL